jgi:hypothetical protein
MKVCLFFSLCLFIVPELQAADAGTTSADFLKVGIGPRAAAMGDAQVGLADDIYSAYWNPAGLAHLKVSEAGFTNTQYVQDITEQFAGYAVPTAYGTFAGQFTYLNVEKFQGYDASGQSIGEIGANDSAMGISYAKTIFGNRRYGSELSVGATGKWIQERLDTVSAGTFAGDLGLAFSPGRSWGEWSEGWRTGLALRNTGKALTFDEESFALPRTITAGVSWSGQIYGEILTWDLDLRKPNDGPVSTGTGLEIWAFNILALRGGYTSEGDLGSGLRIGAGVRFRIVEFDYAFSTMGDFGAVNRIGLTMRFASEAEDPQIIAQRYFDKGMKAYKRQRYPEALVEFNKALEIDPSHPQALGMMKKTYEQIKVMVPAE